MSAETAPVKPDRCCFCGGEAEGNFTIDHPTRDVPDLPLCDACVRAPWPTIEAIHDHIEAVERAGGVE